MIGELFPTGWHLIATFVALGGILLTVGIWIGNVNSDRKSFKEFMKEVKTELKSLGESLKEIKAEQMSFGESLREVKAKQKSIWQSLKRVEEKVINIPAQLPPPVVVERNSPIRLSNFGKEISASLSIDS